MTDSNGVNSTPVVTITIPANRTILGLDPNFFYESMTSLSAAIATAAIVLFWRKPEAI